VTKGGNEKELSSTIYAVAPSLTFLFFVDTIRLLKLLGTTTEEQTLMHGNKLNFVETRLFAGGLRIFFRTQ